MSAGHYSLVNSVPRTLFTGGHYSLLQSDLTHDCTSSSGLQTRKETHVCHYHLECHLLGLAGRQLSWHLSLWDSSWLHNIQHIMFGPQYDSRAVAQPVSALPLTRDLSTCLLWLPTWEPRCIAFVYVSWSMSLIMTSYGCQRHGDVLSQWNEQGQISAE